MKPKKYFAKWIPVEGEINQMDKYLEDGNILTATLTSENYTGLQKVKLFLCSRDIVKLDMIKWIDKDGIAREKKVIEIRGNEFLCSSTYDMWIEKSKCFKLIAEISPDAIWVKEGDEFEQEDVDVWYQHKRFKDDAYVYPDGLVEIKEKLDRYYVACKIKCPTCQTFH